MYGDKKVAVITGASSGIGRETAIGLSSKGWNLILSGRRQEALEETVRLCPGPAPSFVVGNIADEEYVKRLFETVKGVYGRLDLVFNNAGVNAPAVPMEELSLSNFQDVINVNVTGAFLCTREAIKIFKAQTPQGGRIINNGSISAHTPRPNSIAYTVSKHAITGLTKSTALDGRPFNISCTQIDIGNAQTHMTARMEAGVLQPNGETRPEALMEVKHVVDAIIYLADLPNSVTVLNMSILATGMPFVGRG